MNNDTQVMQKLSRLEAALETTNTLLEAVLRGLPGFAVNWAWGYTVGTTEEDEQPYISMWPYSDRLEMRLCKVYVEEFQTIAPWWTLDIENVHQPRNLEPTRGKNKTKREAFLQRGWINPTPTALKIVVFNKAKADGMDLNDVLEESEKRGKVIQDMGENRLVAVLHSWNSTPEWGKQLTSKPAAPPSSPKKESNGQAWGDMDRELVLAGLPTDTANYIDDTTKMETFEQLFPLPAGIQGADRRDAYIGLISTYNKARLVRATSKPDSSPKEQHQAGADEARKLFESLSS